MTLPPPRSGLGRMGASNVNSTTIWTPGGGYVGSGGSTAYVAPVLGVTPACAFGPAATADSDACQKALQLNEQGNMQLLNNANYNSDVGTCESNLALNNQQRAALGLPALPNTCAGNSYGLVPTGGYTGSGSDEEDAAGNPSNVSAAAQVLAAETGQYVPPVPVTPVSSPIATPPQQGGTSAASINSGGSAGSGSGSGSGGSPSGTSNTMLYVLGGIAAVALIIAVVK